MSNSPAELVRARSLRRTLGRATTLAVAIATAAAACGTDATSPSPGGDASSSHSSGATSGVGGLGDATAGASGSSSPPSSGSSISSGSVGGSGAGTSGASGSASDAGDSGPSDGSVVDAPEGGAGPDGAAACAPPTPGSKGSNPLFTDVFSADPAPFVYGCTFYIHCGHDLAAATENAFVMADWFELSSTDMVHWKRTSSTLTTDNTNTRGDTAILSLATFAWANANAWAGQLVAANGKFYWYAPVQQASDGTMAIAVAVADSPSGPFKDAIGKPLINDQFEISNEGYANAAATPYTIDPTVMVDDNGQAYLHYGGFGRMNMARLNPDMISINGKMQELTPQGFFEAAYLIKRNGVYYEIYAAGSNPATIDYSTSTSPLGPWKFRNGVKTAPNVLDAFPSAPGQQAPTNHPGVAEYGGQFYIVYHVSNGPNGGGTYRREVAIDKLNFNADGTIQHVTPSGGLSF